MAIITMRNGRSKSMSPTLDAYREAKSNYLKLRNQAKKELLSRFHELGNELIAVQRELFEDFGEKVHLPTKTSGKKGAKVTPKAPAAAKSAPAETVSAEVTAKVTALRKQLEKQKQKLADLQAAGKPTKTLEDKIYEIEDEIRLAGASGSR
ncbi:MAG: hypothetical protein ABI693_25795 [Bryobacteraceae bacterium]